MTCLVCKRATDARYRPFCSRRCADVDLGRWLTGSYSIPVADDEIDTASEPGRAEDRPDRSHG